MNSSGEAPSSAISAAPAGCLHRCRAGSVGVLEARDECRLVAVRPIAAGERLFEMEGEVTDRPSRHSLQVGEGLHLDIGNGHAFVQILDRYYWRFMNHSCDPNACVRGLEIIAVHDIATWEAVTFNYNTTEWEIAEPFTCRCGSPDCIGEIRGYRHLSDARRSLLTAVAPHLVRTALRESLRIAGLPSA